MSSIDSQKVAEIQNSITALNATVASLMNEVARLSSTASRPTNVMKTSIPLLPMHQAQTIRTRVPHAPPASLPSYSSPSSTPSPLSSYASQAPQEQGRRPYTDMRRTDSDDQYKNRTPIPLSTILQNGEEVTFFVYTGKNEHGLLVRTTAVTVFDGTQLKVTKCDLVPSLIGMQTQKPGEILYRFIDELKNGGHIKRTFSVAPWKLCFVKRNGVEQTLDQLRANLE